MTYSHRPYEGVSYKTLLYAQKQCCYRKVNVFHVRLLFGIRYARIEGWHGAGGAPACCLPKPFNNSDLHMGEISATERSVEHSQYPGETAWRCLSYSPALLLLAFRIYAYTTLHYAVLLHTIHATHKMLQCSGCHIVFVTPIIVPGTTVEYTARHFTLRRSYHKTVSSRTPRRSLYMTQPHATRRYPVVPFYFSGQSRLFSQVTVCPIEVKVASYIASEWHGFLVSISSEGFCCTSIVPRITHSCRLSPSFQLYRLLH